jgi:hypothetical protein
MDATTLFIIVGILGIIIGGSYIAMEKAKAKKQHGTSSHN